LREYFEREPPLRPLLQGLQRSQAETERVLAHLIQNLAANLPLPGLASALGGILSRQLEGPELTRQAAHWLRYIGRDNRPDRLLDWTLDRLIRLTQGKAIRAVLASAMEEALRAYAKRDVAKRIAVWVARNGFTADLDAIAGQVLELIAMELNHARQREPGTTGFRLRNQVREWFTLALDGLASDPARLREQVTLLLEPFTKPEAEGGRLDKLLRGLAGQVSDERTGVAEALARRLMRWLESVPGGGPLDRALGQAIPEWLHQAGLRDQLERTLQGYTDDELAALTQSYVANDLQWIRVSGTVVGFVAGIGLMGIIFLVDCVTRLAGFP
jgi:uncharacterized membrane-anchored protein YjiN (DUF445 family)